MSKIKEPSVAGLFYPEELRNLKKAIENFHKENDYSVVPVGFSTRACILPHAGFLYSGSLAFKGLDYFDRNIKTIFIFAPAHRAYFKGLSLSTYDFWQTPFGKIEIDSAKNLEIISKFKSRYEINFNDEAYNGEHSIEVQTPLIQALFKDVKIVPILVGKENPEAIEDIINSFYFNKNNGFIISSDLSHFLTDKKAKELDLKAANLIETNKQQALTSEMACGAVGIAGLMNFAKKNNFSLIRVGMLNSSAATGDTKRVVGYGAWVLFEGAKNEFIQRYYSDFTLQLCKTAIKSAFCKDTVQIKYHKVFDELGASFVTLEENGMLRGCIGSIRPYRNLILDLISNAKNAAFNDPRFSAVREGEADNLKISVSLLGAPLKLHFSTEEELLNLLIPHKDGLIIREGSAQAVYLPSVWETIQNKKEFLDTLKIKAGLGKNYFSNTLEAYRFDTVYIQGEIP